MEKIKFIILVAIVIFATNSSFSQEVKKSPPTKHKQFGIENRIPDLSDAQKDQIKTERTSFMADVLPIKNQLKEKQAHLNTLQTAKTVDMKAVNSTLDEIGALKIDLSKRAANHRQKIRSILNDEQRVYFDSHIGKNKRTHSRYNK